MHLGSFAAGGHSVVQVLAATGKQPGSWRTALPTPVLPWEDMGRKPIYIFVPFLTVWCHKCRTFSNTKRYYSTYRGQCLQALAGAAKIWCFIPLQSLPKTRTMPTYRFWWMAIPPTIKHCSRFCLTFPPISAMLRCTAPWLHLAAVWVNNFT